MAEPKNCKNCQWHRQVSTTFYVTCIHPEMCDERGAAMLDVIHSHTHAREGFTVRFDKRGVAKGHIAFPNSFDSYWLESCSGHERITLKRGLLRAFIESIKQQIF